MKTRYTDFLIIGSGFGAAAPALRLSQEGHKVLMIEKGENISGKQDFKQTQDPKYIQRYIKGMSGRNINFTYAEGMGGGSGFYEMVSLRAPSMCFTQKDNSGRSLWPGNINRSELDKYYDVAEEMLNVSQIPLEKVPKSGVVFSSLMKNLGYSCDRARYAVVRCMGSGFCLTGCIFGAKQSLHYNYIPKAKDHGLELLSHTDANEILPLSGVDGYKYLVRCTHNKESLSIRTKVLILAAGTVGSAKLLLNSKKHLPDLSDQAGKNICFNGSVKVAGLLPDDYLEADMFKGMSHPGMISYHFLKERGITISSAKPQPIYLTGTNQFNIKGENKDSFWGEANVELMKKIRSRMIVLYALGYSPQTAEIVLKPDGKFEAKLDINEELKKYYEDTRDLMNNILERNDCKVLEIQSFNTKWKEQKGIKFSTAHMTGSCRMAERVEDGVVDKDGKVFNYEDFYITGGSVVPSSLAVNTSLTILANAERISESIIKTYS